MISAQQVKELRETTGAGMMDCKKALTETNGDMEKAVDFLREKGLAAAAKKSGRIASHAYIVGSNPHHVIAATSYPDDISGPRVSERSHFIPCSLFLSPGRRALHR